MIMLLQLTHVISCLYKTECGGGGEKKQSESTELTVPVKGLPGGRSGQKTGGGVEAAEIRALSDLARLGVLNVRLLSTALVCIALI